MGDLIDRIFERWAGPDSPGCSVGVFRHGALQDARGYGMASIEHGVPNGPDTSFYVGSVGKQFIASCVALLVRDGALDLDADVREIVPQAAGLPVPVALRHLLHHTSGVRDCYALQGVGGLPREAIDSEAAMGALLSRQRSLNFQPGSQFLYSNSNYFLLAQAVARVVGRPIAEFGQERLFGPLGMKDTCFRPDWRQIVRNRATGYGRRSDGWHVDESWVNVVAGGGIVTTVRDGAAWDGMFLEDPFGIVAIMLGRGTLNDGRELPYACGLQHGTHGGRPTVSHGGSWVGFRSELLRFPDERLAIAVYANASDMAPGALARRMADVLLAPTGAVLDPLARPLRASQSSVPSPRPSGAAPIPSPEAVAGLYRGRSGSPIYRLVATDGVLSLEAGGTSLPVERDGDLLRVGGIEITFASFDPPVMRIGTGAGEPVELDLVREVDVADPAAHVGRYRSDELDTTIEVCLEDGRLAFVGGRPARGSFTAIADGTFVAGGLSVRFEDENLFIDADRARAVRFARTR